MPTAFSTKKHENPSIIGQSEQEDFVYTKQTFVNMSEKMIKERKSFKKIIFEGWV